MLTVDERMVFLTILIGMGESNFYVFPFQVNDRVEAISCHVVCQQVLQSVAAEDAATVIHDGQPLIQVGVVAQHRFHDICMEGIVLEEFVVVIRNKVDKGTTFILAIRGLVAFQDASLEGQCANLSVTIGFYFKVTAQGIDSFHADTVQTNTFLKGFRVVFTTRIQYAHRFDEFSLRNAASVVAYRYPKVFVDIDFNALAGIHLEFINTVVDDFLQQHIDTVFG